MTQHVLPSITWGASIGAMALGAVVVSAGGGQVSHASHTGPVVMTSQQDRQRMMDQLRITAFPPSPGAYLATTYDERTASPYPNLPDPLLMNNGTKVTTPAQWRRRRAEIVELFDREVYGRRPTATPKIVWEVRTSETTSGSTALVSKQLIGKVDNSAYPALTVNLIATLTVPKDATGPVPVVLAFGGPANVDGVAPTTVCQSPNAAPAGPPAVPAAARVGGPGVPGAGAPAAPALPPAPSVADQVYARGWGYATVSTGSIQADNGQGLTCGIIGLVNKGQPRKVDDWGVLSAWGWGMSRVLDYFETDKSVDARRVAVFGHSRTGKAALVALSYDERFATGFISSSGQAGAKLHRRKYGETVENIAATNEYHWMAGNYLKYTGRWDQMPVDAHSLVALVAPRPVFLSTGKGPDTNPDGSVKMMIPGDPGFLASRGPIEQQAANINDAWVDPKGTFLAGVGAGPVYRLLGKKDLGTTEFPQIETGIVTGDVAFRQHAAGHTPGPNWPVFLEFAARYFNAPRAQASR